ncbi:Protein N-acetyltransferase, RimJ/RimL family [Chitinophaga costaii]|uniref:Protein N-acetyltransferase, RimJ/RimL family n=1 Tax=Chitinophaga costaii TaxID=1335309 RepID=A0A1C4EID5_9BACT|nr:GNAT family N-acetyltransferase [Chitinophaga costaii]PUZ23805.1 N-acetyltransferase [Chitinophaga costaii]SCC43334.1 Protein N-acetyltransferase, RimJ/RimL family [Chitinophaga costaii]
MRYFIDTPRLALRRFVLTDDVFIHRLLNTPTWIQFIGDRHITDLTAAQNYLQNVPFQSYQAYGYGPWLVYGKQEKMPIGMCGFFRRPFLVAPDVGFAFLPAFEGQGFAREALTACMDYARSILGFPQLYAFTFPANERCIRLLERTGFRYQELIHLPSEVKPMMLFTATFPLSSKI